MHMTTFSPDESPRSLQLYTVDPATTYTAARMVAVEGLADHIDMNFGCPVPKVTRRGGGAALPFKRRLFGQIVAAAVRATEGTDVPVTVKFRVGIDEDHHTTWMPGASPRPKAPPRSHCMPVRRRSATPGAPIGSRLPSSSSKCGRSRCSATGTSTMRAMRWP